MSVADYSTLSQFPEPVAVQRNVPEIFQIFHNVQFNTIQHKKYIKELKKVYRKIDENAFRDSFTNAMHYLFLFGDANSNVDRVMQFVANFCAALSDGEDFLLYVFSVIFDCVSVSGHGVRQRSCQLLGLILDSLGEEASLDDELYGKIVASQLDRLQDVRKAVRCSAARTLHRLQNPMDEEDSVTRAYTFHMRCDPSPAVRRAVILVIAKNSRSLLFVLERLCDVDESVRKAAFLYISSINVTQLKVRQRVHILKVGLTERSQRVRRVVETALLPGWLGAYQGNVLELLAAVRLDNLQGAKDSALVAGNLLQSLFKHQQLAELLEWLPVDKQLKLIPADKLTKESAWYWRHLVKHLHSIEDTEHLEQVLPELVIYSGYVRALLESPCPNALEKPVEYSRRQYVLQELINIFPVYDMADEVGRVALQSLLYDTLTGNHGPLEPDVIHATVRAIDLVIPDAKKRIEYVAGIISEIHEPAEVDMNAPPTPLETNEMKILKARLRVSLNEAQEELEDAVREKDFGSAQSCKDKVDSLQKQLNELNSNHNQLKEAQPAPEPVREKKNDPETLNKCLLILNMVLDTPDITSLTPVLRSLYQNFEVMIYQNVEIRENALQTVAFYSMLDEEFAKEHKAFFFAQFIDVDNEKLVITALKCVIDILCIYGVKMFNITPEVKESKEIPESEDDEECLFDTEKSKRKSKMLNKSKKNDKSLQNKDNKELSDSDVDEENKTVTPTSTHDTIIELFLRLMNSECAEYRAVVAEGLCRLLLAGRLTSSNLISRLLLLWFNPATEEEDILRQLLGTFFPLFAANTEGSQEQLEAAFLPTISTLANAPLNSPLAEVDPEAVLKFMIGLTLPTITAGAMNVHANLCVQIVNALDRGCELEAPLYCRALSLLAVPRTQALCKDLLRSASALLEIYTDKTLCRHIGRFQATLAIILETFEQRASAANPAMETLTELTEPSILDSPQSAQGSDVPPISDSPKDDDLTALSDKMEDVDIESVSSPSKSEGSDSPKTSDAATPSPVRKIPRLTANDVAMRALVKTPRTTRKKSAETPVSTPSMTTRRSARATPSAKSVTPAVKETKPARGQAAKTLQNRFKNASANIIETKQSKATNDANGKNAKTKKSNTKKSKESSPTSSSSPGNRSTRSSTRSEISETSDDETIMHTIRYEDEQEMSMLNESSDVEDNEKPMESVIVPETDSSDQFSTSSDDESIPVIKNIITRRPARTNPRKK